MKEGPELILATKAFASDNPLKSWWSIISTALLLAAALTGTLFFQNLGAKAILSLLSGLLILRMFVIYHDQQHHAILPHSRLAEFLMRAFGLFALSASSVWRSSHNHHHNHNSKLRGSHIGSFPIMTKSQFLSSSKGKQRTYLFIRHPLTILFGYFFMFMYGMCINPFMNHPRKHADCLVSLIIHILIGTALVLFFGLDELLFFQTFPSLIAFGIGSYLFYAQHNFPGVSFRDNSSWAYDKAALESSSFMRTSKVMGWFTANIGYHHVHHLNAKIPFYRLPEVVRALPELQRAKETSLHPRDVWRCLRLKLWDSDRQEMIALDDINPAAKSSV
jgi:omega-6 fatty acid desaturase (delta-12 desaturase)